MKNNICEKISIEKCVRVDTNGKCIVCEDGILAKNGICDSNNECTIKNCKYCGDDNGTEMCVFCDSGYAVFPTSTTE